MPRLSIIIPLLGQTDLLESTLVSVLQHRPGACEIIVVVSGNYGDPYQLDGEVRFLSAPQDAGFVDCINLGIGASQSPYVHILASGVEVTEGWADAALANFEDRRVAAVAPLTFDLIDHHRVIAAGIKHGSGGTRRLAKAACSTESVPVLGPSATAAFYRKSALQLTGGFDTAAGDELADLDLALRLKHVGFRAVLDPYCRVLGMGEPITRCGDFRRALQAECVFWRNVPVTGWSQTVAMHPLVVAAEAVKNCYRPKVVAQLAGRFLGLCQIGNHLRHHGRLALQREEAAAELSIRNNANLRIDKSHPTASTATRQEAQVREYDYDTHR